MKKPLLFSIVPLAAMAMAACDADPTALNRGNREEAPEQEEGAVPEGHQCTDKPEGREYLLPDGTKLTALRTNENIGVNRARIKPFAVLGGEFQRVLGIVPTALADAADSFESPPERWYEEAAHSGVSLGAFYNLSFAGCLQANKANPQMASAPTAATAKTYCETTMRKAWNRSASPEEINGCVDLAMTKLATEANAPKRWSYVCASILSSSNFLTF